MLIKRMKRALSAALQAIREDEPGRRFEAGHERHRIDNHVVRITLIVVGAVLLVSAAVTFWVPGPNFVIVLAGLALVATQWRLVARLMDRGELAARRWHVQRWMPYSHKRRATVLMATAGLLVVALLAWLATARGWLPGWLPLVG